MSVNALQKPTVKILPPILKQFAAKGNAVDMAVGILVGGAFTKIVNSIVSDLLMPPIGVLIGGWMCDYFQKRYEDGYVRVCLVSFIVMAFGYCLFTLMPTPQLAVLFLIPATLGAAAPTAAGAAAVVSIAPPTMRAQCVAFYYFILNAVGFFVGPTAVALVTDFYFADEEQLRYSMFAVAAAVSVIGTWLLLYNLPHFRAAAREAKQWTEGAV